MNTDYDLDKNYTQKSLSIKYRFQVVFFQLPNKKRCSQNFYPIFFQSKKFHHRAISFLKHPYKYSLSYVCVKYGSPLKKYVDYDFILQNKKNSKNKSFMFHFISKMQCNCISFTSNRATHRSRDIDGKPYFNLKIVPRSPLYQSKQPFSLILDIFRLKKASF